MNKAITDGLELDLPAFSDGLGNWSSQSGLPGEDAWDASPFAAFVPADQDFGGCLETFKQSPTQKVRCFLETPMPDGLYLRVTARVKAVSGAMPLVRIAGVPVAPGGAPLPGVTNGGPQVQLDTYGEVVTVSAIIGTGRRTGVDLRWPGAAYAHVGVDLLGPSGGTVRIDDLTVEDVTSYFIRDLVSAVDVIDYGAVGDGTTDDTAAFVAAHDAAEGRTLLVPEGTYRIEGNLTLRCPVRFEGFLSMPDGAELSLTRDYSFQSYADAFEDEETALRKAIQALFIFTDHADLDLGGRRIGVSAPIDVAAVAGRDSYAIRRTIRNGDIEALDGPAWADGVVTASATYDPDDAQRRLTSVNNIGQIEVGARVSGAGVGREVYVVSVDTGAKTAELSQPLFGGAGRQSYTFTRNRYLLDYSGFEQFSKHVIDSVGFQCNGRASGIMLAKRGVAFQVRECAFNKPKDRAITSYFEGCQGMKIDRNEFESNEQSARAQDRTSIVYNSNANDTKIRDNRAVLFAAFGVVHGTGHTIAGNHWFCGDDEANGVRQPGLILTTPSSKTTITGNYVDNNTIELTNEHEAFPNFASQFSFGGLTITGNIFTANGVGPWFRWLRVKPYGTGHFVSGLTCSHNTFRALNGKVDRIEEVDTTYGSLNLQRMVNVVFEANAFAGVTQATVNPAILSFQQSSAERVWEIGFGAEFPFGAGARTCTAIVARGKIRDAGGSAIYTMPYADTFKGADSNEVHVNWSEPAKGTIQITARMDNPS